MDCILNIFFVHFKSAIGYVWLVNSLDCMLLILLFWLVWFLSTLWIKIGSRYNVVILFDVCSAFLVVSPLAP